LLAIWGALPAFAGQVDDVSPAKPHIDTITVEAERDRKAIERQVNAFVSGIAVAPRDQSLANWQTSVPLCPLVAGLPRDDGEYMLARISKMAKAAGAPLAAEHCRPNFFVIVTSEVNALLKAWGRRDPTMFGDAGGTLIHKFSTHPHRYGLGTTQIFIIPTGRRSATTTIRAASISRKRGSTFALRLRESASTRCEIWRR
jgi:hypothetical protein